MMPCSNAIARLLIKQGKAKVKKRTPFVIKLLYNTTNHAQSCTLGIDTGSYVVGSAVVSESGSVLYMSEVEIRNDITDKMARRSKYRRNRRNRKTRYRKARWLNRVNSNKKDRFSPTMTSKINSHLKEIKFVRSILPITKLILETATFDPHLLKNPSLKYNKWGYQKGTNYGFANTKAYVLNRDNYTCLHCKGKSKDGKLEVHHIIFKSDGGSDDQENLITLCSTCHFALHHDKFKLKLNGKKKTQLKHSTQMNSIRCQLLKQLECEETFGFITKENRQALDLPKEHYMDAVVIAGGGDQITFVNQTLLKKKCIPYRDIQKTKGIRSEQRITTGKIQGFKRFDKVKYLGNEYFIKGRMSTGYVILMSVNGEKIDFSKSPKGFKTPKLNNCKRIEARKSWIISEQVIQNIA